MTLANCMQKAYLFMPGKTFGKLDILFITGWWWKKAQSGEGVSGERGEACVKMFSHFPILNIIDIDIDIVS